MWLGGGSFESLGRARWAAGSAATCWLSFLFYYLDAQLPLATRGHSTPIQCAPIADLAHPLVGPVARKLESSRANARAHQHRRRHLFRRDQGAASNRSVGRQLTLSMQARLARNRQRAGRQAATQTRH